MAAAASYVAVGVKSAYIHHAPILWEGAGRGGARVATTATWARGQLTYGVMLQQ